MSPGNSPDVQALPTPDLLNRQFWGGTGSCAFAQALQVILILANTWESQDEREAWYTRKPLIRALKVPWENTMLIGQGQGQEEAKSHRKQQTLYLGTSRESSLAKIRGTKRWTQKVMLEKNRYGSGQKKTTLYSAGQEKSMRIWQKRLTRSNYPSINIFGNQILYHIINNKRWQWTRKSHWWFIPKYSYKESISTDNQRIPIHNL